MSETHQCFQLDNVCGIVVPEGRFRFIPTVKVIVMLELHKRNWFVLILLSIIAFFILAGAIVCGVMIHVEDSLLFLPIAIVLFVGGVLFVIGAVRAGRIRHIHLDAESWKFSLGKKTEFDINIRDLSEVKTRRIEVKGHHSGPPPEGLSLLDRGGREIYFISGSSDLAYKDIARIIKELTIIQADADFTLSVTNPIIKGIFEKMNK